MTEQIGTLVTSDVNKSAGVIVTIPELNDAANINEAFRVYHLGTSGSRNQTPDANSIASHLQYLYTQVSGIPSPPTALTGTEDISTTAVYLLSSAGAGYATATYYVPSSPSHASFPSVYPTTGTQRFPGILTINRMPVSPTQAYVIQTYSSTLAASAGTFGIDSQKTAIFWRSTVVNIANGVNTPAGWTEWVQAASQEQISLLKVKLGNSTAADLAYITGIGATPATGSLQTRLAAVELTASNASTAAGTANTALSGKVTTANNLSEFKGLNSATARSNLDIFRTATSGTAGTVVSTGAKVYIANPAVVGATGAGFGTDPVAGDLWFW